jgi:hypothetical protein
VINVADTRQMFIVLESGSANNAHPALDAQLSPPLAEGHGIVPNRAGTRFASDDTVSLFHPLKRGALHGRQE